MPSKRKQVATAKPVSKKQAAEPPPEVVPAKVVDTDPQEGAAANGGGQEVMGFFMEQIKTLQGELKGAGKRIEDEVEKRQGLEEQIKYLKEQLEKATTQLARADSNCQHQCAEISQLKEALKAEKKAAEDAAAAAEDDSAASGTEEEEEEEDEKPKAERKAGKRGKKATDGTGTRKVNKKDICHDFPDRKLLNFANSPYFESLSISTKELFAPEFWKQEKKSLKSAVKKAEAALQEEEEKAPYENKEAKLAQLKEDVAKAKYEQKTYSTNHAENVVTLLTAKEAPWAQNIKDGVLQVDIDALLKFMFKPEFENSSGGGITDGQTARRWYITQLLHPGVYKNMEDARSKENKSTWEAMGKIVTAVNKANELVTTWKNTKPKPQATKEEALDLRDKFDKVPKIKAKKESKASKGPKKTIQKKPPSKKKAKKGGEEDSDAGSVEEM